MIDTVIFYNDFEFELFEYLYYKMLFIKPINEKDSDLCYELDANTMSLWSKKQWTNEFKKEGTKIYGLSLENFVIGICVMN